MRRFIIGFSLIIFISLSLAQISPDVLQSPPDGSNFDRTDGSPTFSFRAGMPGWHYYWISTNPDDCERNNGDMWHANVALAADSVHIFTIPSDVWNSMSGTYYWHTVRTELGGDPPYYFSENCWSFNVSYDRIEEKSSRKPGSSELNAYPNPFNKAILLSYENTRAPKSIEVYDIFGKKVAILDNEKPGWLPETDIPAGLYLIVVRFPEYLKTVKVFYLK